MLSLRRWARAGALASLVAAVMSWPVMAEPSDPLRLYAAGSLRDALDAVAAAYGAATGRKVSARYGPSGLLKDEIAGGAKADVFASANMEHPQALAAAGKAGPVVLFARNRLCALARPGLAVDSATLADRMLDPAIRLGTSTPKADPSGDYAWEVFRKLDALRPGSFATLDRKALRLMGGSLAPPPPPAAGRVIYGAFVADGQADIFLTYCTGALAAQRENPGQQIVQLPENLAVGADYGMTVIDGAAPAAADFALFVMSIDGQRLLAQFGFSAPALPQQQ